MAADQELIDVWTPVHGVTGLLGGLAGVSPVAYVALSLTYELFEQTVEMRRGTEAESAMNALGDLGIGLLCYVVGSYLRGSAQAPSLHSQRF